MEDDRAAVKAVGAEINRPDPARWRAMTTDDDRLRQTYRALGLLLKQTEVAFAERKAALRAFRGSRREYQQAAAEYEAWKSRAVHFVTCARARRSELVRRFSILDRDDALDRLGTALRSLAAAVAAHREAISGGGREETTADRLLWLRLDLLPATMRPGSAEHVPDQA
ncbi:hypothetical protein DMP23_47400 [Amycolatopsis sp. A1MSW2902]